MLRMMSEKKDKMEDGYLLHSDGNLSSRIILRKHYSVFTTDTFHGRKALPKMQERNKRGLF